MDGAEALFDRRDELLGDAAALDVVHEFDTLAVVGLQAHDDVGELALAAGLLLELVLIEDFVGDGFAEGHGRFADRDFDLVLGLEPVDDDLQVQLAHARDHRLLGLLVVMDLEGGVFERQLVQRRATACPCP